MSDEKDLGGRPTLFSNELADTICSLLSEGLSLRAVCRKDDMPCKATVFKWLRENSTFSDQYARAKEEAADAMFEDIQDIADDQVGNAVLDDNGIPMIDAMGRPLKVVDGPAVQHAALRVNTRKWMMSKMKPKKYGEKVAHEHGGKDGNPITTVVMKPDEYKKARAEMLGDDDV